MGSGPRISAGSVGGRWDSNTSEKIQRYMGYLLKSGKEDGIYTDAQGSAPLSQVAKILQEKTPRPVG